MIRDQLSVLQDQLHGEETGLDPREPDHVIVIAFGKEAHYFKTKENAGSKGRICHLAKGDDNADIRCFAGHYSTSERGLLPTKK